MKSSRRKQTNPNRVSAGAHNIESGPLPVLVDELTNQKKDIQEETGKMERNSTPNSPVFNNPNRDFESPLDMHVPVNACSIYSRTSPHQKEMYSHRSEIKTPEFKKPRLEGSLDDFPTEYHRLGRELQENTDLPTANGHEMSPGLPDADRTSPQREFHDPLPHKLPVVEKSENEFLYSENSQIQLNLTPRSIKEINGEPVNGKTDRIFHIDAYCELCDREFCNKYFLKTHKANKHGIYEDSPPPSTSGSLSFPGLMIPQDPLASFNFKLDTVKPQIPDPIMPWSFKLDSTQIIKPESLSITKSPDRSLPLFTMPNIETPKPSFNSNSSNSNSSVIPVSSVCLTGSSINTTSILTNITNSLKNGLSSSTTAAPSNDTSMEDYCHICQKHFCNKYYLRKHKQDVHGIVPDNPPNNCNKRSRSVLLDLPMTSSNALMLPPSLASLAGMHNLPGLPGMPNINNMSNMHPGVMVINPYSLPPVAIIPTGSMMQGQQIPPPPHPIISQSMGVAPISEANLLPPILSTSVPSSNTINSIGQTPIRTSPITQEGGVHCNICSKEFCNDFYLQMHKESKHGSRRNSEDISRDKVFQIQKEKDEESTNPSPITHMTKNEMFPALPRSPVDREHGLENNIFICNFCNKDFTNKYLYRIHRIHEHGLNEVFEPLLTGGNGELQHREHAMNNFNESLMRMAADASAVGYASSFGAPQMSNKQETVTCDICNKQLANQHFLRLHKFNVHGKDPAYVDRFESKPENYLSLPTSKPKTPPSSNNLSISSPNQLSINLPPLPSKSHMLPFLPPKIDFKDMPPFPDFSRDFKGFRDMPSFLADTINNELFARSHSSTMHMDLNNFFGLPSVGKLPIDDNVKLNFDPEAYCEICKKEFCSKYFLRTHKQNIHGIKNDATSSSSSKSSDSDKINTVAQPKPTLFSSNGKPKDFLDKNSWRWKEPMNSSRVICDICNKEVCNKYFLRIHKQKKHGQISSSHSPSISMSGSPVVSDCDTASNASSHPDEKSFKMDQANLPQVIPLPPTERVPEKFHMMSLDFANSNKDISLNNNTGEIETCNICNRRFKNLTWLKDHIIKDHSENEALDMTSKNCPSIYTCQVCGIVFSAELSVKLHLIQDHNARVTIDTDEPQIPNEEASLPNSEGNSTRVAELSGRWTLRKKISNHQRLKKYVCSRCGFDSHWLSSLLDHERNEHGFISDEAPAYSCKSCYHMLPSLKSLTTHMISVHGLPIEDALHEAKVAEAMFPNSFKCAHCPAVFPTRSWGMAHVRHVHIRSRRDLAIKNSFAKTLFKCSSCSFKTHFAFRLQRHFKCRHVNSLRSVLGSNHLIHPPSPVISSASNLRKTCDVSNLNHSSREDNNLINNSAMYKSIAATLLSAPDSERKHIAVKTPNSESVLLQSYKLPMCASPVDSSFKMAIQTTASAVVGL